jgi:hypothetical protein
MYSISNLYFGILLQAFVPFCTQADDAQEIEVCAQRKGKIKRVGFREAQGTAV